MEKSGKSLKTVMLTLKIQVSVTLLITDAFVNSLAVHDTKHLKFRVQKFESHSVFGIEEYIIQEISAFKSQFCNVFVHIKMNKVPRKVGKTAVRFLFDVLHCWFASNYCF